MLRTLVFVLALVLAAAPAAAAGLAVGQSGGEFSATAPDGATVSLKGLREAEGTNAVIVQFTSLDCPFSQRADSIFIPLTTEWAERGVRGVAIYPNYGETDDRIAMYRTKAKAVHKGVRDPDGKIAKAYGAEVTPTFYLFDREGVVRFRGSLTGLKAAVEAVLAGEEVARPTSPAVGCTIKLTAPEEEAPTAGEGGDAVPVAPPVAELSEAALKWLDQLLEKLDSTDPAVQRSAIAAITALGPPAVPRLRRVQAGTEGERYDLLERIIHGINNPPRRRTARPMSDASMLDMQLRAMEQLLDLSDEQRKKLRLGFVGLRDLENELRQARRERNRTMVQAKWKELLEKSQKVVKSVLTEAQWERWENLRQTNIRRGQRAGGGERGPGDDERGPGDDERGPGGGGEPERGDEKR